MTNVLCPLLTIGRIPKTQWEDCQADNCAWWNSYHEQCAIVDLGEISSKLFKIISKLS